MAAFLGGRTFIPAPPPQSGTSRAAATAPVCKVRARAPLGVVATVSFCQARLRVGRLPPGVPGSRHQVAVAAAAAAVHWRGWCAVPAACHAAASWVRHRWRASTPGSCHVAPLHGRHLKLPPDHMLPRILGPLVLDRAAVDRWFGCIPVRAEPAGPSGRPARPPSHTVPPRPLAPRFPVGRPQAADRRVVRRAELHRPSYCRGLDGTAGG